MLSSWRVERRRLASWDWINCWCWNLKYIYEQTSSTVLQDGSGRGHGQCCYICAWAIVQYCSKPTSAILLHLPMLITFSEAFAWCWYRRWVFLSSLRFRIRSNVLHIVPCRPEPTFKNCNSSTPVFRATLNSPRDTDRYIFCPNIQPTNALRWVMIRATSWRDDPHASNKRGIKWDN